MTRVVLILLNVLTALSVAAFVGALALWVRSHQVADALTFPGEAAWVEFTSSRGRVACRVDNGARPVREDARGVRHESYADPDALELTRTSNSRVYRRWLGFEYQFRVDAPSCAEGK